MQLQIAINKTTELQIRPNEERRPSPNPDKDPSYYRYLTQGNPGDDVGFGDADERYGSEQKEEEVKIPWVTDNILFTTGVFANNVAGLYTGVKEYSYVRDGHWKGKNGKWYPMKHGANRYTGKRSDALNKAGNFKFAGRLLFGLGAAVSLTNIALSYAYDDYSGIGKNLLDIGAAAAATFGGPGGMFVGGTYFFIDSIQTGTRPELSNNLHAPAVVQDNTYVAPPIIPFLPSNY